MDEAERLCDKLAIIDRGKIAIIGTPAGLRDQLKRDVVMIEVDRSKNYQAEQLKALEQEVANLPVVKETVRDGSQLRFYVESNQTTLPQILEAARAVDISIWSITLSRPGLDEVFLHHTGHSLKQGGERDA